MRSRPPLPRRRAFKPSSIYRSSPDGRLPHWLAPRAERRYAMAHSIAVDESRVIAIATEDAFARTLPAPLPQLFHRRRGIFPPIEEVRDQTGAWDAAGQTRTVRLAGGASMREE